MDVLIQVRNRGVITLPAELREKYGIENGDVFRLVDLDGVFVLTPMVPMIPELAREIEQARVEAGLSIEDLLEGLREQRARYNQEKDEICRPTGRSSEIQPTNWGMDDEGADSWTGGI
jgi:bifunctional DNA-binding transcriptional regulator/antitoxin component of YhaV-PrlF toxin-antitoxin module